MLNRFLAVVAIIFMNGATVMAQTDSAAEKSCSAYETISETVNCYMQPVEKALNATIFYAIDTGYTYADGSAIEFPVVVMWLFGAGLFFTFYFRFINIRGFRQSIKIVKGTYDDPNDPGEVTHFQALTAAVSGTVGLGNIAGVAIAVSIGGPGAVFWMILAGLFGMSTKFAECTLGVKYREIDENGSVTGGPMMYLQKGLANRGWPTLGKALAIFAAVMCIGGAYGAGAMFQVNQSSMQFTNEIVALTGGEESFFNGKPWIFGVIFASFVGLVIIGGIRKITHVTEFLVPVMAIIYVTASLFIIFSHITEVPSALALIFESAFSSEAGMGGYHRSLDPRLKTRNIL
ncbi:alanine:cation symporter family protein [Temperatibacter marinus]|uniref:Alanine:cation symporter family protein n=1 Tax=Temperatibacter marinus TaxID=1456591 RepID=A0AA52ECV7_9PROT|nr:alanine:cation symporter family protein [Temperatibacter marinus]WND02431.1 alanine:cation symporter family protein [Temperatibacter marinus]